MNNKNIYQRIDTVNDEVKKLENLIFSIQTTDIHTYPQNYEKLSMDAALRAERIACKLRNLVYTTDQPAKAAYMEQAAEAHQIHLTEENRILSISLPGLLPKRRVHTNTAFLNEPLNFALSEYCRTHQLQLYRNCVVCFSQIYENTSPPNRIRDYDNLEFKQILDTISSYILFDDSGLFCDTYHTTEFGISDATVVYIMERSSFPDWLKSRKNMIETISEIL